MTVSSAQTNVATLKAALVGYITSITHTDATTITVLKAQATLSLDNWENASKAEANASASVASNYSNGVGMSLGKKSSAECRIEAEGHMDAFRRACLLGGVTVPTFGDEGVALWDMSQASHD
jgi:hypothetical protein